MCTHSRPLQESTSSVGPVWVDYYTNNYSGYDSHLFPLRLVDIHGMKLQKFLVYMLVARVRLGTGVMRYHVFAK
jgi:hypothetical protein